MSARLGGEDVAEPLSEPAVDTEPVGREEAGVVLDGDPAEKEIAVPGGRAGFDRDAVGCDQSVVLLMVAEKPDVDVVALAGGGTGGWRGCRTGLPGTQGVAQSGA